MIPYIEYLKLPTQIAVALVGVLLVLNIIGELLEFKGKVVPEFMKLRKHFSKKKNERKETAQTLKEVKTLLSEVNAHYSADNITKRDDWMHWVNDRAQVYDDSIVAINAKLSEVTEALKDNSKITEEMFIQSSRDRIIDFAAKVIDDKVIVSREEFNRIFKVYNKYEKFLEERHLTNGEIDIAIHIIKEAYERHMKEHTFLEDVRGITKV